MPTNLLSVSAKLKCKKSMVSNYVLCVKHAIIYHESYKLKSDKF